MSNNKRFLADFSEAEFRLLVKETVSESISELSLNQNSDSGVLMKMKEVAEHFRVTLPTIHKWRRLKILPRAIKKGGRVFFLRKQIIETIINKP